jgi:hypothetical protein
MAMMINAEATSIDGWLSANPKASKAPMNTAMASMHTPMVAMMLTMMLIFVPFVLCVDVCHDVLMY